MIKIKNLYMENDKILFNNRNFEFDKQKYWIKGRNGSGKTSLFNAITNLTEYSGTIEINGQNINAMSHSDILSNYITYIKQEDDFIEYLSVEETLSIYIQGIDEVKIKELIRIFEIEQIMNNKISDLSGGERKKLQIVIGLAFDRKILILDEVDNYLDDDAIKILINHIINYDGLVLFTMHGLNNIDGVIEIDINKDYVLNDNEKELIEIKKYELEIKNPSKLIKRKYKYINYLFLLILITLQVLAIQDILAKDNFFTTDFKPIFAQDNVLLVRPAVYGPYSSAYGNSSWYETTPYLLDDNFVDMVYQTGYAKDVEPLQDINAITSTIDYEGNQYFTDGTISVSNIPYDIAKTMRVNLTPPEDIIGDIPHDDSNEILITENYQTATGLEIGDIVNVTLINMDDGSTFNVPYTVCGINKNEKETTNIVSYQTNSLFYQSQDVNENEEAQERIIEFIEVNTNQKNIENKIDPSQNYYETLWIETNTSKDAVKLINELYDYDPYLFIQSNHQNETNKVTKYSKSHHYQKFIQILVGLIIFLIIQFVIYNLELKNLKKTCIDKLDNYGYNEKELEKIIRCLRRIYYKLFYVLIIVSVVLLLFSKMLLFSFGLIICEILSLVLFKILIRKKGNYNENKN